MCLVCKASAFVLLEDLESSNYIHSFEEVNERFEFSLADDKVFYVDWNSSSNISNLIKMYLNYYPLLNHLKDKTNIVKFIKRINVHMENRLNEVLKDYGLLKSEPESIDSMFEDVEASNNDNSFDSFTKRLGDELGISQEDLELVETPIGMALKLKIK